MLFMSLVLKDKHPKIHTSLSVPIEDGDVERYRGGGSSADSSSAPSEGSPDDEEAAADLATPHLPSLHNEDGLCRYIYIYIHFYKIRKMNKRPILITGTNKYL